MTAPAPRRVMGLGLAQRPAVPVRPLSLRPVTDADADALARVMHQAYLGGVDEDAQTLEAAQQDLAYTFRGDYGELLRPASFVALDETGPCAALLITRWRDAPLVAFVFTAPPQQRRGLARALLVHGMEALARLHERELLLVVTRSNAPAVRLYEQLGFVDYDPSRVS